MLHLCFYIFQYINEKILYVLNLSFLLKGKKDKVCNIHEANFWQSTLKQLKVILTSIFITCGYANIKKVILKIDLLM